MHVYDENLIGIINRQALTDFSHLLIMRSLAKLTLVLLSLGILYWPGIRKHWEMTKDPYFVPFDAVQYIPPFFKFDRNHPIPTTYVKEYYLSAVCPLLYKWLTMPPPKWR